MKYGKLGRVLMGSALSASLIASAGMPYNVMANEQVQKTKNTKVVEVLKSLSDEQRKALKELEMGPGFVIAPDVKINSPELIEVIVEFKQAPAKVEMMLQMERGKTMSLSLAEDKVEASHQQFKKEFDLLTASKLSESEKVSESKITREYRHSFNGVALKIPGNMVEKLVQSDVVKRVWSNKEVKVDPPIDPVQPFDTNTAEHSGTADSNHQIGADKLHDEEITGNGIKVGVIDTGIDYNHPDLKNAYKGGYDFVDNDSDPMETTYKDWKGTNYPEFHPQTGSSYYTSHGTHVSGTIAGQKSNLVDYAVKGVAPESDLYVYRVLGPYGSGTTDAVLAGIDKAVEDELDVINLSLGAMINDPLYPTSVAINNAMLSGVVSVVSGGNAGPSEKTIGSPGTSAFAITVGASDFSQSIVTYSVNAGELLFDEMKLLGKNYTDRLEELENKSYEIVYAGLGNVSDFQGKDLTGKLALIQRGTLAFDDKIKNAVNAGAEAVIIYNNVDGEIPVYLGESSSYVPTFQLTKEDGEQLAAIENGTLTFGVMSATQTEGDYLADFSSRGPVEDNYDIKPDVVAPGVSIFSAYPEFMNHPEDGDNYDIAYTRMNGTSMAAPHVAGAAALILQKHPEYTPFDVKAALMNTADELKEKYSVYEVGAGRIDIYEAVHTGVSIKVMDKTQNVEGNQIVEVDEETGSIAFGSYYQKDDAIRVSKNVVIKNLDQTEAKEYRIEVEFLPSNGSTQDAVKNGVELSVPSNIYLSPGQSEEMIPTLHVPANAAEGRYEGYIHLVNLQNEEENYQIPFAVRYTGKGIDHVELDRPAVATDLSMYHPALYPFINATFKLKSPMETIDIIIKDGKTGEPVGFLGAIGNADQIPTDQLLYLFWVFNGWVFPFTDDASNPIADRPVMLPDGDYLFEMIATDKDGNTYINDQVIIVDNEGPKLTFEDFKPGFYEVDPSMYTDEDGYHALWTHANAYDSTIDVLKSKGFSYDQTQNIVYYFENSAFPSGTLPVQPNGDFKFGVLPQEIEKPMTLSLYPIDLASASDLTSNNNYTFVKEGTEYALPSYNKEQIKLGEEITMTLSLNNVKEFIRGKFGVEFDKQLFEFKDAKVNADFEKYAKENNVTVALDKPTINDTGWGKSVQVGASIVQSEFKGFDGDFPFIDVTFKLINDEYYMGSYGFGVNNFSYDKVGATKSTKIPAFWGDSFNVIPKHSVVEGYIFPEAYVNEDGYLINVDYSKIGAKVYAKAGNGKAYHGVIDKYGYMEIHGIPVSDKDYDIYVEVPGHLTSKQTIKLSKNQDGELFGKFVRANMDMNYAGDVNGDSLIDIKDMVQITALYGKKSSKEDINNDGIVDEKDVRFIEENFLRVGADAKKNAKPLEKLGKKGLNDFLLALGLKPKKN